MTWMICTTCNNLVDRSATGICLSCQRGFIGTPQEDHHGRRLEELKKKEKEVEDAIQKPITEGVPVCHESKSSKRVRSKDTKRKKTPKKSKKEK